MRRTVQIMSLLVGAALWGGVAMPTWAVDGVILIDQNKAMAGGVTPGDAPGFPVSINLPGSYRFAGNLTVPNENTTAIEINADHVTVDFNGFAILGPTDCSGGLLPCARQGLGSGVSSPAVRFNITIRNGTIQGVGRWGIFLQGDEHLVEYMHVRSNGCGGIVIHASADLGGSIVQNNAIQRNGGVRTDQFTIGPCSPFGNPGSPGGAGIAMFRGLIAHNVVDVNVAGIGLDVGSVSYNTVTRNLFDALELSETSSYIGNVVNGNGSPQISGGTNLGQNLCNNVVCPGASF